MLKSLYIKNFALIKETSVIFQKGFIAITGETGAGKSIILDALNLVLGARKDSNKFNSNSGKCVLEATFGLIDLNLENWFKSHDIDYEVNTIFRREILESGKSRTFINDTPVSLEQLKDLSNQLVRIHTQNNNAELRDPKNHLKLLDEYGSDKNDLVKFKKLHREWKKHLIELNGLKKKRIESINNLDFNKFQLAEFGEIELENFDFNSLKEEFELLNHADDILNAINEINTLIGDEGSLHLINQAENKLLTFKEISKFQIQAERLGQTYLELKDIVYELNSLKDSTEANPAKKNALEQQVNTINSLLYKHRVESIEELQNIKGDIETLINQAENFDEIISVKKKEIEILEKELHKYSDLLHKKRVSQGKNLVEEVQTNLEYLKMGKSKIELQFERTNDFQENGNDKVQFLLSSDNGQSFSPLSKTASGGENSRINLALKSALAKKYSISTLIFDEIDTGVSGEVATKMGNLLRDMSKHKQIVSITHLPQVASLSRQHFLVFKNDDDTVYSELKELDIEEKTKEIAKMLSGHSITQQAIENAKVLMNS